MNLFLLDSYVSTFRETSFDKTKNESLLGDIRKRVVNFDDYASSVSKVYRKGENLSSADALAVAGEDILLIEFKNQRLSQIEARRIQKKAFDSLHLFLHLEGLGDLSLEDVRRRVSYFVLYREDDIPSFTRWQRKATGLSSAVALPFGLDPFLRFYKSIKAMSADEFCQSKLYESIH